jgi:hypothetical protein
MLQCHCMNSLALIHQGVLFVHVAAFAIAFSAVVREDIALVKAQRVDMERLSHTAKTLTGALIVLWLTGLALMGFAIDGNPDALITRPKLLAKLLVVSALTANGLALHAFALPRLGRARTQERPDVTVPVVLGAISTASWLYASFIGVARVIAPSMSLQDFMLWYAALLVFAIAVGLVFVRPRLARVAFGSQ